VGRVPLPPLAAVLSFIDCINRADLDGVSAVGSRVAVVGATTGSHLGLPDEEELELSVIWVADVDGGALSSWQIAEDTPDARRRYGVLAGSSTST
jgi:hypothetical protein